MSTALPETGGGAATATTGPQRHLGLALLVIAPAQLMVVRDATIVNVALPHIQHALPPVPSAISAWPCWSSPPPSSW